MTGGTAKPLADEARRLTSPALLLALIGRVAMRQLRETHTAHDLTPRQFHLLDLLHEQGGMGQRELGLMMDTDPSILVTMLNPLEADGLISRDRDAEDRRRHLVTLTPAGERRLLCATEAQRQAEDELLAGLDDEQREQLQALLLALQDSLTVGCDSACSMASEDDCETAA